MVMMLFSPKVKSQRTENSKHTWGMGDVIRGKKTGRSAANEGYFIVQVKTSIDYCILTERVAGSLKEALCEMRNFLLVQ